MTVRLASVRASGGKPGWLAVVRRAARSERVNDNRSGSWPKSFAVECISHRMA